MLRTLALCALGVSALSAAEAPPFRWAGSIPAGNSLEVRGVNGNINVEQSTSLTTEVNATITAKRSDPNQVRVHMEHKGSNILICVLYLDNSGTCDGRQSTKENDTNVNFTVKLPKGVLLLARTVNGGVKSGKLQSDVDAKSVNGNVEITTTEGAVAQTVNGTIRANVGKLQPNAKFASVNGSIHLALPANAGANLDASTVNGDINPEFPLTLTGKISKRHLNGKLGNGGPALSVKTVNGSIHITKSSLI